MLSSPLWMPETGDVAEDMIVQRGAAAQPCFVVCGLHCCVRKALSRAKQGIDLHIPKACVRACV